MKDLKNLVKLNIIYVLAFAFFLNIIGRLTGFEVPLKAQILFVYLLLIFLLEVKPTFDILIAILLIVLLFVPIFLKDRSNIDQLATFSYMFFALGVIRSFLAEVFVSKSLIIRVLRKSTIRVFKFFELVLK